MKLDPETGERMAFASGRPYPNPNDTECPAIYLLEAFGLHDPWVRWRIAHGYMTDDDRLTSAPLFEDAGDDASLQLAYRLGIPIEYDPYHQLRIDRRGLHGRRL